VFCGQQLLCAYLRESRIDAAKHSAAILKLLLTRVRQQWPQVRIVFRGDSGFCRQRIINYCERANVHYTIGLQATTEFMELSMKDAFEHRAVKQREVGEFTYGAQSYSKERRVITRLQYSAQGSNPRYVVTTVDQPPAPGPRDDTKMARNPRRGGVVAFCHHSLRRSVRPLSSNCPVIPRATSIRGLSGQAAEVA
jgi:Transposase DDE domain group 1